MTRKIFKRPSQRLFNSNYAKRSKYKVLFNIIYLEQAFKSRKTLKWYNWDLNE